MQSFLVICKFSSGNRILLVLTLCTLLEYRATPLASPPSAIFLPPPPAAPGKTATEAKTSSSTAPEPAAPLAVDARCIPRLFRSLLSLSLPAAVDRRLVTVTHSPTASTLS